MISKYSKYWIFLGLIGAALPLSNMPKAQAQLVKNFGKAGFGHHTMDGFYSDPAYIRQVIFKEEAELSRETDCFSNFLKSSDNLSRVSVGGMAILALEISKPPQEKNYKITAYYGYPAIYGEDGFSKMEMTNKERFLEIYRAPDRYSIYTFTCTSVR